ncbi:helix-turn-helix domain-containing protein [Nocardioides sp. NPDC057772]|uniref:helix-turn-helix domain-containing protein n=1 Tax=Nocardioides sp. NPDC057772 TaxID=3346245 RepID=UPI00366CD4A9
MNQDRSAWEMTFAYQDVLSAGSAGEDVRSATWMLVDDGTVVLTAAGQSHLLRAGDAALVGGQVSHRLATHDGANLIRADLRAVAVGYPLANPLVVRDFVGRHGGVAELLRRCPLAGPCRPSALFASGYASLLGAAMTASWLEDTGRGTDGPAPVLDPTVAQVLSALVEDPGRAWSVESMAESVHLSRSALGERFRRSLGQSPSEALRDVRMRAARHLLAGGDRPVEQVAYAVGYGSGAAFSRAFTAIHGIGPQAWREDPSGAGHAERTEARRRHGRPDRADEEHVADAVLVEDRAS